MEELLQMLESTANMMRGMLFDPSIPNMAKTAMTEKISDIEEMVEKYVS